MNLREAQASCSMKRKKLYAQVKPGHDVLVSDPGSLFASGMTTKGGHLPLIFANSASSNSRASSISMIGMESRIG
jgi:hypothetical protein